MPSDFAGDAKATDRLVRKRAAALTRDLLSIRDDQRDAFMAATGLDDVAKGKRKRKPTAGTATLLTLTEIAAIRAAIAELDAKAYVDSLSDETTVLVEVAYKDAAALLDVSSSFDTPPVWAIDKAKDAAAHVGSLIDERDKAALTKTLEDALTEGLRSTEMADRLREAFDVIAGPDRVTRSDAWFETVARTELQSAAVSGQMALYDAAGVQKVRWQAAEPCDECAQYDDEVYALDDVPEGGPPLHPNCRCIMVPMDEDLGDWRGTAADREAARRGNAPTDEE